MMKKLFSLLLVAVLVLTLVPAVALVESTTIPANKDAKAGTTLKKSNAGEPYIDFKGVLPGSSITFWVWRNGDSQVTPTYTFTSTGVKTVFYMPSKKVKKGNRVHPVWKKVETGQSGVSVTVSYEFKP